MDTMTQKIITNSIIITNSKEKNNKGDIVKQPMKKGSFVPKNVPGVGWGGVGLGGVGWGGVGWGGWVMKGWGGVGWGVSCRGGWGGS